MGLNAGQRTVGWLFVEGEKPLVGPASSVRFMASDRSRAADSRLDRRKNYGIK
jgi:hypothetical protein